MQPTRRELLGSFAGLCLAGRTGILGFPRTRSEKPEVRPQAPLLSHITLKTHKLPEVKAFYGKALGLATLSEARNAVSFRAGLTTLEFEKADGDDKPYYHFAFNIPENKFETAKAWLTQRAKPLINSESKLDYIYFKPPFNMHSVYFHDPADNIVEFCARHDLPNWAEGPFSSADILYASEIAVSAADYLAVITELKTALSLKSFNLDNFLGDAYGLVLVFPKDRPWIPERTQPGTVNQTKVVLSGNDKLHYKAKDHPFEFVGNKG